MPTDVVWAAGVPVPTPPIAAPLPAPGPTVWGRAETVFKTVTGGLGLVAAIGYPAAAMQMVRFGVPTTSVTYEQILRAGVVPAAVLVLLGAYAVAGVRVVAEHGWRRFFGLHSLILIPVIVPAGIVLIIGAVAFAVLTIWAMFRFYLFVGHLIWDFEISDQTLLLVSAGLLAATGLAMGGKVLVERYAPATFGRLQEWVRRWLPRDVTDEPAQPEHAPRTDGPASTSDGDLDWGVVPILLLVALLYVYSLWGVVRVWDPALVAPIRHAYLLTAAFSMGLLFVAFYLGAALMSGRARSGLHASNGRMLFIAVSIAYLVFEVSYSAWMYPRLPASVGGGRAEPVTLWLKHDDGAGDIVDALAGASASTARGATRIDGVYVLGESRDGMLITNAARAPALTLAVARSRVIAMSWRQAAPQQRR